MLMDSHHSRNNIPVSCRVFDRFCQLVGSAIFNTGDSNYIVDWVDKQLKQLDSEDLLHSTLLIRVDDIQYIQTGVTL